MVCVTARRPLGVQAGLDHERLGGALGVGGQGERTGEQPEPEDDRRPARSGAAQASGGSWRARGTECHSPGPGTGRTRKWSPSPSPGPDAWQGCACDAAAVDRFAPAGRAVHGTGVPRSDPGSTGLRLPGIRPAALRRRRAGVRADRPAAAPSGPGIPLRTLLLALIGVAPGGAGRAGHRQPDRAAVGGRLRQRRLPGAAAGHRPAAAAATRDVRAGRAVDHRQRVLRPDGAGSRCAATPSRSTSTTASDEQLEAHFEGLMECLVRVWQPPVTAAGLPDRPPDRHASTATRSPPSAATSG